MSIFQTPPSRWILNGDSEDNEIREIFYQHWQGMNEKMNIAMKVIDRWRRDSIAKIDEHAQQQLELLQHHYNERRYIFDESRRKNIDTAIACRNRSQQQTAEVFAQLREACRKLEFQVASLENFKHEIDYIKVISVQERQKKEREEKARQQNMTINTSTAMTLGSPSNSTSPSTSSRQSSTTNTPNSSNRRDGDRYGDTSVDTCPLCFMIYSPTMDLNSRTTHVNDHD